MEQSSHLQSRQTHCHPREGGSRQSGNKKRRGSRSQTSLEPMPRLEFDVPHPPPLWTCVPKNTGIWASIPRRLCMGKQCRVPPRPDSRQSCEHFILPRPDHPGATEPTARLRGKPVGAVAGISINCPKREAIKERGADTDGTSLGSAQLEHA